MVFNASVNDRSLRSYPIPSTNESVILTLAKVFSINSLSRTRDPITLPNLKKLSNPKLTLSALTRLPNPKYPSSK